MKAWNANLHNLVFVDVETTGLSPSNDRVIEVGIVRVKGNKVVERFNALVNPGFKVSTETTRITGITNYKLRDAVEFKDIAADVRRLLNQGVFVAHNAPFDYGFLEHEFARLDLGFSAPRICTVDLSRALYPGEQSHSLDAISARFNIKITNRHRAFDDAMATWFFFQKAMDTFDDYALELAFKRVFQPAANPRITKFSNSQLSLLA